LLIGSPFFLHKECETENTLKEERERERGVESVSVEEE